MNYTGDDLRWTIVYRARCFEDAEAADRYAAQKDTGAASLEDILAVLRKDLAAKGKGTPEALDQLPILDLAMLLLDTYVRYPLPPRAAIPYNYCALPSLFPSLHHVLKFVCDDA